MPAYVQGSPNLPLQALYPGGIPATVWSAEALVTGTPSSAIAIALLPDNNVASVSFEVKFSAAPGAFEIDIQEADTDEDAAYTNIANAVITDAQLNSSGVYARIDIVGQRSKFLRAMPAIKPANAVNATGKFTR